MATTLMLAFKATDGRISNIRINNPRADVTRAEALAVMQDIIEKDVFRTPTGASLAAVEDVYTVVTTKTTVLV